MATCKKHRSLIFMGSCPVCGDTGDTEQEDKKNIRPTKEELLLRMNKAIKAIDDCYNYKKLSVVAQLVADTAAQLASREEDP